MGHKYTTKLFVIHPKLECHRLSCILCTNSGQAWAPRRPSFSVWNLDGSDNYNLSHSLGDSILITHISVKKVSFPTEKTVFLVAELLSHQK